MRSSNFRPYIWLFAAIALGSAVVASAEHSWGGYHWSRTANPFSIALGDNVSSAWDSYLLTTSNDWSQSAVLDTAITPGKTTSRSCRPTTGRAEICNYRYGRNGWLGMATIWASGSHITQGTVKMNDSYFAYAPYNTLAWKNLVMCQEVGHIFGLDHQDEDFYNTPLGTCMDYSSDPTLNQHPNQHDYDMLETIYAHLEATSSPAQRLPQGTPAIDFNNLREWGQEIRRSTDRRASLFERNLGRGQKVFTFVFWADAEKNTDH